MWGRLGEQFECEIEVCVVGDLEEMWWNFGGVLIIFIPEKCPFYRDGRV